MEDKNKYQRIAHEYDPNQCQQVSCFGKNQKQCNLVKVPGSNYCQIHGGNKIEQKQEKEKLDMYRLTKYQARLDQFKGVNEIKNLKDEIGILRVVLEEILNQIEGPAELMAYSNKITDLTGHIEKLVTSTHKLDLSLGQYLDKTQALNLIETIVSIINKTNIAEEVKALLASEILKATEKSIEDAQKSVMKES